MKQQPSRKQLHRLPQLSLAHISLLLLAGRSLATLPSPGNVPSLLLESFIPELCWAQQWRGGDALAPALGLVIIPWRDSIPMECIIQRVIPGFWSWQRDHQCHDGVMIMGSRWPWGICGGTEAGDGAVPCKEQLLKSPENKDLLLISSSGTQKAAVGWGKMVNSCNRRNKSGNAAWPGCRGAEAAHQSDDQGIPFQARAEAGEGAEIWARCLHSSGERQQEALRYDTGVGKEILKVWGSLPALSTGPQPTLSSCATEPPRSFRGTQLVNHRYSGFNLHSRVAWSVLRVTSS